MLFVFVVCFGAMAVRLVMLQIIEAPEYIRLASQQREREIIFPARRGAILDRAGEPLAISVDMFMVYTDHIHLEDEQETATKLAPLLDPTSSNSWHDRCRPRSLGRSGSSIFAGST
jgi:cell division protein FtsI (penicillin-binding protein 3)